MSQIDLVLDAVLAGAKTTDDVAQATGLSKQVCSAYLSRLVKRKRISRLDRHASRIGQTGPGAHLYGQEFDIYESVDLKPSVETKKAELMQRLAIRLRALRGCKTGDVPCPFCWWTEAEFTHYHAETGCMYIIGQLLTDLAGGSDGPDAR